MSNWMVFLLCWACGIVGFVGGAAWCGLMRDTDDVVEGPTDERD